MVRATKLAIRFGALAACVSLAVGGAAAQEKKKPCAGGELRVRHAFSECRNKVWHVVEVGYYVCPNGRVEDHELGASPTGQACDKEKGGKETPWTLTANQYRELDTGCQAPKAVEPLVFLECVNEQWAYSTYSQYECQDGSRRIQKPAKSIDRSGTPCTQAPPRYKYSG